MSAIMDLYMLEKHICILFFTVNFYERTIKLSMLFLFFWLQLLVKHAGMYEFPNLNEKEKSSSKVEFKFYTNYRIS